MASAFYLDVPASDPANPQAKIWDFVSSLDGSAVLIGEFGQADRTPKKNTPLFGKTLGVSHAIHNNNKSANYNFWSLISQQVKAVDHSSSKTIRDSARNILEAALLYPGELMTTAEISKQGNKLFWAQDIEFYPGEIGDATPQTTANEVYAGIIALLWAGRHYYGADLKIIPVAGSAVLQNLNPANAQSKGYGGFVDIESLLASNTYLAQLKLGALPKINNKSPNLMSTLHKNGLIDGFINQDYNVSKLPGQEPMATFSASLNTSFANQVKYVNVVADPTLNHPFKLYYSGDSLPVDASVYFTTRANAKHVNPIDNFFTPTKNNIISINASHFQDLLGSPVVDLTSLPGNQSVDVVVELGRNAGNDSYAGFYKVSDASGAVNDPLTGQLILPGDPSYAKVALDKGNLISSMTDFKLDQNGRQDVVRTVLEGFMMAPFAVTTVSGKETPYFAFLDANSDGINHFKRLGQNAFGFEDIYGGGDFDYNDLELSLRFMDVT